MSQAHPLDAFRSLIDEGVDDAEIARMAEVSVLEVRKWKARQKSDAAASAASAASAAEAPAAPTTKTAPDAEAPATKTAPDASAVLIPKRGGHVALARELVAKHPGRLVVRLSRGFAVDLISQRTGKPATHPVLQSDYKDGMAVHITRLAVETGNEDALVFMDPSSPEYPPSTV